MANLRLEAVQYCMKQPELIRNVCILAHVDHGKTTIADALLATNGLVSRRQAGQLRYMDDRVDEQKRGITMKSSAVSLVNSFPMGSRYSIPTKSTDNTKNEKQQNLLLNLIDTPGHIDFSSEVTAALRVCEGAFIVVDLVEGVCAQTREAIRQAYAERCQMILILNKLDKLIVELKKSPLEIFLTIRTAVEDCNAIVAELYQIEHGDDHSALDIEHTGYLFVPKEGNVIFASAMDGWGFTTKLFAEMFQSEINGETVETLNEKIWDFDAYVDAKTRTIKQGAIEKVKTNVFIKICLQTIIHIYDTIVIRSDKEKVAVFADKLKIPLTNELKHDMKHTKVNVQLRALMQAWSNLGIVMMQQCVQKVSCPLNSDRLEGLVDLERHHIDNMTDPYQHECCEHLKTVLKQGKDSPETFVYISKMICINKKQMSQNRPKVFKPRQRTENTTDDAQSAAKDNPSKNDELKEKTNEPEKDFEIIAFARVFGGTLKVGQKLLILPQNYKPKDPTLLSQEQLEKQELLQCATVTDLYVFLGRDLELLDEIPAGNVCAIGVLEANVTRTATLSSFRKCISFPELEITSPIVRNSIEPENPRDLPKLRHGLRALMQSDSCVQVEIEENGELILVTAGDVHLAKCIEDLTQIFVKNCEIIVSRPIISLRETITPSLNAKDDLIEIDLEPFLLTVHVAPLESELALEIENNYEILSEIEDAEPSFGLASKWSIDSCKETLRSSQIKKSKSSLDLAKENLEKFIPLKTVWSVGRMSDSINLLVNDTDYYRNIFETLNEQDRRSCYDHLVVNAFYTLCKHGPICEEPLKNCVFTIKKFELKDVKKNSTETKLSEYQIEAAIVSGFREAFSKQRSRLMEPVFTTSIQVNNGILGKVYLVVSRRHGKVLNAVELDEKKHLFLVKAEIPVVDSEGFANEIRKTTSGHAIPNLKFSHYELIDGDVYFERVEDDDELEGINVESALRATMLRKDVCRRKGLYVEDQVVVHAEKQRTLNKKK